MNEIIDRRRRAAASSPPAMIGLRALLPAVLMGCWLPALPATADTQGRFHTSPELWPQPRLFHQPSQPDYEERLVLDSGVTADVEPQLYSANDGYWLAGGSEGGWSATPDGILRASAPARDLVLYIHNEREGLWRLRILARHPNYPVTARWLNEKLVFVRVWWGRVLGSDLILDVEHGRFIYREMLHDGVISFQQFLRQGPTEDTDPPDQCPEAQSPQSNPPRGHARLQTRSPSTQNPAPKPADPRGAERPRAEDQPQTGHNRKQASPSSNSD